MKINSFRIHLTQTMGLITLALSIFIISCGPAAPTGEQNPDKKNH